jgi:acyl-homoserine lactone acylase PvdQ
LPKRSSILEAVHIRNGSDPANDWKEYHPFTDNPHVINPKDGFIVSCNNKANGGSAFHSLGTTISTTPRAVRARKMLEEKISRGEKVTLEFFKEMQLDVMDENSKKACPLLLNLTNKYKHKFANDKEIKIIDRMIEILKGWDGSYRMDSKEAMIYYKWVDIMHDSLLQEQFTDLQERVTILGSFFIENFLGRFAIEWNNGQNLESIYCRNERNKDKDLYCMSNLITSLLNTYKYITDRFGTNEVNTIIIM